MKYKKKRENIVEKHKSRKNKKTKLPQFFVVKLQLKSFSKKKKSLHKKVFFFNLIRKKKKKLHAKKKFFFITKKKPTKKKMLGEFAWDADGASYLGILKQHPLDPEIRSEEGKLFNSVSPEEIKANKKKFPLLYHIFGWYGFFGDDNWDEDREFLEDSLAEEAGFTAWIWYPASFGYSESSFEEVKVTHDPEKKGDIHIHALDGEEIILTTLTKDNLFETQGFEVVKSSELKSKYEFDLCNDTSKRVFETLRDKICLRNHADREVNGRQIYYLTKNLFDELEHDDVMSYFEEKLHLRKLYPLICDCLFTDPEDNELFNAFACVIPAGKHIGPQAVHRDSLYDSVSLFFYLSEPCDPQTGFFPFSHRILTAVKHQISTQQCPKLDVGDVLFMDGKLLHHGLGSTTFVHDQPRILFIFQYRAKCTRAKRSKNIQRALQATSHHPDQFVTNFHHAD